MNGLWGGKRGVVRGFSRLPHRFERTSIHGIPRFVDRLIDHSVVVVATTIAIRRLPTLRCGILL
jgi:hypothetical protein